MAFSRYKNTGTVFNDTDEHATTIGRRGLSFVRHHRSVRMKEMTLEQEKRLVNQYENFASNFYKRTGIYNFQTNYANRSTIPDVKTTNEILNDFDNFFVSREPR